MPTIDDHLLSVHEAHLYLWQKYKLWVSPENLRWMIQQQKIASTKRPARVVHVHALDALAKARQAHEQRQLARQLARQSKGRS